LDCKETVLRRGEQKKLAEEAAARKAARLHVIGILLVAALVALGVWTYLVNRPTREIMIQRPRQTIIDTPEMQRAEKDWINEKARSIVFQILDWREARQTGEGLQTSYAGLGRKFVSARVRVTNTSKDRITVNAIDLGLEADNGSSYKGLTMLGGKVPPVSFEVAPNQSKIGMLVFEVDQDVRNGKIGFLMPE
jgi:hypothetical protein